MFYSKLPIVLLSEMVSAKDDSTNGHIAAYILGHIEEVPSLSIREIAAKTNVSPASISRFCRDIGLEDFNELKELAEKTELNFEVCSKGDKPQNWKDTYIADVVESINHVGNSISMEKIEKLCKDIRDYDKVAVFGVLKAEGVAMNLQADLAMQGKFVVTKLPFSEQMDYFEQADENNLIVIFSYTGIYFDYGLPQALKKPKKERPKIYLITGAPIAPDADIYNTIIRFKSKQDQHSHPYQLQMVESLIAQNYAYLNLKEE